MAPGPDNLPLVFVQTCPGKGEEQSITTTPSMAPATSEQLLYHLLAGWPVMLAASTEGQNVCPCLPLLQTQSGPEQLETWVFYVPLAPCCLLPARRVHWLLFLSVTNVLINLRTLLLDHSNVLFKIIIWKITWQRTLLLFLSWKGARFTKDPWAGLW